MAYDHSAERREGISVTWDGLTLPISRHPKMWMGTRGQDTLSPKEPIGAGRQAYITK